VRGNLEGDRQDPKSMSMRGLQINNPRRDGFLRSDTTLLDSFDIERVEAIGGSNSPSSAPAMPAVSSPVTPSALTSIAARSRSPRPPIPKVRSATRSTPARATGCSPSASTAVEADTEYFRPNISQATEGAHVAATFRPWKWLEVRGEYREYKRDAILAQAVIVRAPLTLLLPERRPRLQPKLPLPRGLPRGPQSHRRQV